MDTQGLHFLHINWPVQYVTKGSEVLIVIDQLLAAYQFVCSECMVEEILYAHKSSVMGFSSTKCSIKI